MGLSTTEILVQATIAVFMITMPVDPVKILFFNSTVEREGLKRVPAAVRVAISVVVILGLAAVVGRELLELLGINLNAFGVVGGLVVALMGFEMLYGGEPSKAQGKDEAEAGPDEGSGLLMPLAIPLIAGPGAITTVITVSSFKDDGSTIVAALVAVGVVGIATFLSMAFLGGLIAKATPAATALLQRLGGLLLATIGTQMLLGSLKQFFEAMPN